jgi:hypothetical protein
MKEIKTHMNNVSKTITIEIKLTMEGSFDISKVDSLAGLNMHMGNISG